MKFHRIYVEITNVCGLACSFCPTKNLPSKKMSLEFFEQVIKESSSYTKEVALHVMGDPLVLSNLHEYLYIVKKYKMSAMITTSGFFLNAHEPKILLDTPIKQINISLNSFDKNETSLCLEEYMKPIFKLCEAKLEQFHQPFINLRLWNMDEKFSSKAFNEKLFQKLSAHFKIELDIQNIYEQGLKTVRLASKILLHFDNYFEWPSLNNQLYGDGKCLGLDSHIAILSDGRVVPCCLDGDGVINLGNLHTQTMEDILNSNRVKSIKNGFQNHKAVEDLCKRCSYKIRFN